MQPQEFCLYLKGFFDSLETNSLNEKQTEKLKSTLDSVFVHDNSNKSNDEETSDVKPMISNFGNDLNNFPKPKQFPNSPPSDILVRC